MVKLYHLFPLSVFQSSAELAPQERAQLVDAVIAMTQARPPVKHGGAMWSGDMNGWELLHNDARFAGMFAKFKQPLFDYLEFLRVDQSKVRLHYTRSWATLSHGKESTHAHQHMQSHISLVYYLSKPDESAGIAFINKDVPNQFAPQLFGAHLVAQGIVRDTQLYNSTKIYLEPKQGDVLIFPSKAMHEVPPSPGLSGVRISIACDIVMTVRNSAGLEYMMPDPGSWKSID